MNSRPSFRYPSLLVVDFLRLVAYAISKPLWLLRYRGRSNIPHDDAGGFLIVSNHQTYIDPVWICLPIRKRKIRYIAFDAAFEWRIVGPLIRYLGAFPISQDKGSIGSMKEALRSLKDGAAVVVFPEGAREFANGEMLDFKKGAVHLALQAKVPILPVTISGGHRIWPQKQRYPNLFRRIELTYHPLVRPENEAGSDGRDDAAYWTERIRKIIAGQP